MDIDTMNTGYPWMSNIKNKVHQNYIKYSTF